MRVRSFFAMAVFRRLLPVLLLPALLQGAGAAAPGHPADDGPDTVSAVDALRASPALPAAAGMAVLSALDAPAPLRAPERLGREHVSAPFRGATAGPHVTRLDRGYLGYARTLVRARLGLPATSSKPPPSSVA